MLSRKSSSNQVRNQVRNQVYNQLKEDIQKIKEERGNNNNNV